MATYPAWFDADLYYATKAEQLNAIGYNDQLWSSATVQAYFSSNDVDPYEHFVQYGNKENISPNQYFVVAEYLAAKAAQLNELAYQGKTDWNEASVQAAFTEAGLSAWDHYLKYGAKEGINPSNAFDQDVYYAAKAQALNAMNNGQGYGDNGNAWTASLVKDYFDEHGVNPLQHFATYAGEANEVSATEDVTVPEEDQVETDPTYDVYTQTADNPAVTSLDVNAASDRDASITASMTVENAASGTDVTVAVNDATYTLTYDGTSWTSSDSALAYDGTTLTYTRDTAEVNDGNSDTYAISAYAGTNSGKALSGSVTTTYPEAGLDIPANLDDTAETVPTTLTLTAFEDDTTLAVKVGKVVEGEDTTYTTYTGTLAEDGSLSFDGEGLTATAVEGQSGVYTLTYTRPTADVADHNADTYAFGLVVNSTESEVGSITTTALPYSATVALASDTLDDAAETLDMTLTVENAYANDTVTIYVQSAEGQSESTPTVTADEEVTTTADSDTTGDTSTDTTDDTTSTSSTPEGAEVFVGTFDSEGNLTFDAEGMTATKNEDGTYTLSYTRPASSVNNLVADTYTVSYLVGKAETVTTLDPVTTTFDATVANAALTFASEPVDDTEATIDGSLRLQGFTADTSLTVTVNDESFTGTVTLDSDGNVSAVDFGSESLVATANADEANTFTVVYTRPASDVMNHKDDSYTFTTVVGENTREETVTTSAEEFTATVSLADSEGDDTEPTVSFDLTTQNMYVTDTVYVKVGDTVFEGTLSEDGESLTFEQAASTSDPTAVGDDEPATGEETATADVGGTTGAAEDGSASSEDVGSLAATKAGDGAWTVVYTRPVADVADHNEDTYTFAVSPDGTTYGTAEKYTTVAEKFEPVFAVTDDTNDDTAENIMGSLTAANMYTTDKLYVRVSNGDAEDTWLGTLSEDSAGVKTLTFAPENADSESGAELSAAAGDTDDVWVITYKRPTADVKDHQDDAYTFQLSKDGTTFDEGVGYETKALDFVPSIAFGEDEDNDTSAEITGTLTLENFYGNESLFVKVAGGDGDDQVSTVFVATYDAETKALTFAEQEASSDASTSDTTEADPTTTADGETTSADSSSESTDTTTTDSSDTTADETSSSVSLTATLNEDGTYTLVYNRPTSHVKNHVDSNYTFSVSTDGESFDDGVAYGTTAADAAAVPSFAATTFPDADGELTFNIALTDIYDGDEVTVTMTVTPEGGEATVREFTGTMQDGALSLTTESEDAGEMTATLTAGEAANSYTAAVTYTRPSAEVKDYVADSYSVVTTVGEAASEAVSITSEVSGAKEALTPNLKGEVWNGTDGDDTLTAVITSSTTTTSLDSTDQIDGGSGSNVFELTEMAKSFSGFTGSGSMANMQTVKITSTATNPVTFSAKGVTGVTAYELTGPVNLSDVSATENALPTVTAGAREKDFSVVFATDAVSGDSDTFTLNITDFATAKSGDIAVTVSGGTVETMNLNVTGTNLLDLSKVNATSLVVAGEGSAAISALNAATTSFDGSAATGNIDLTIAGTSNALTSVKTGAGDDTVTVDVSKDVAKDATLDGGDGDEDVLVLNGTNTGLGYTITGFETIQLGFTGATTLSLDGASGYNTIAAADSMSGAVELKDLSGDLTISLQGSNANTNGASLIVDADGEVTVNVDTPASGATAASPSENGVDVAAASASGLILNVAENMLYKDGTLAADMATSVAMNVSGAMSNAFISAKSATDLTITSTSTSGVSFGVDGTSVTTLNVSNAGNLTVVGTLGNDKSVLSSLTTLTSTGSGGLDLSDVSGGLSALETAEISNAGAVSLGALGSGSNANSMNVTVNGASSFTANSILTSGASSSVEIDVTVAGSGDISLAKETDGKIDAGSGGLADLTIKATATSGKIEVGDIAGKDVSINASSTGSGDITIGSGSAAGILNLVVDGTKGDVTIGDFDASGAITLDATTSTGTFTIAALSSTSGGISINGSGSTSVFTVGTLSGSSDVAVSTGKGGLTVDSATSASGDVTITSSGNLSISGDISAASGDVSISASGALAVAGVTVGGDFTFTNATANSSTFALDDNNSGGISFGSGTHTMTLTTGAGDDTFAFVASGSMASGGTITITGDVGAGTDEVYVDLSKGTGASGAVTVAMSNLAHYENSTITLLSGASLTTVNLAAKGGADTIVLASSGDKVTVNNFESSDVLDLSTAFEGVTSTEVVSSGDDAVSSGSSDTLYIFQSSGDLTYMTGFATGTNSVYAVVQNGTTAKLCEITAASETGATDGEAIVTLTGVSTIVEGNFELASAQSNP